MNDADPEHRAAQEAEAHTFPSRGRLAAVDFGSVRHGVAICDPDRILASPYEVRRTEGAEKDAAYFREVAHQERIAGFVVGLPIHCDGGESLKSRECREFASWLAAETGLPVRLFDERFTTAAASQRMRSGRYSRKGKKERLDAIAALVLLESFLEACRYHGDTAGIAAGSRAHGGDALED